MNRRLRRKYISRKDQILSSIYISDIYKNCELAPFIILFFLNFPFVPLPEFCGIILRHGSHYLLLQRGGHAKYWPFYWGFPGGKIEAGETALEAAIRETQEEIGV